MTFTTSVKEEIVKNEDNQLEARLELSGFIKSTLGKTKNIVITSENASIARYLYKRIKEVFNISPLITIRMQKRFRVKQIYILTIKEKVDFIKDSLEIDSSKITLESNEEKIAFLKGVFLGIGNISNPQTSGYHAEFICSNEKFSNFIIKLLKDFEINAKIVKRGYKYVVYIKASEQISDLLRMFKATSAFFFFEDIRIYRDHKNMVNRLNNCEISNQTRAIETGLRQIESIKYLKDNDLLDLLDEKTRIVIEAREKYPETSLTELAEIITLEYGYKIGKSGVNHHFIKVNELVKRHQNRNEN